MARSWLSIRVKLIEGGGRTLWPRPGRVFAAARSTRSPRSLTRSTHDGAYGIGAGRVACQSADEDLLGASINWIDDNDHNERFLSEVEIERSGTDSALVRGAFDGGGQAKFQAVATCLEI